MCFYLTWSRYAPTIIKELTHTEGDITVPAYTTAKRWERLAQDIGWKHSIPELRLFLLKTVMVMSEEDYGIREAMIRYYFKRGIQRPGDPQDSRFQQFLVIGRQIMRTLNEWEAARDDGYLDVNSSNELELLEWIEGSLVNG